MTDDEVTAGRVAVLGNGPVGQTAALLLARWGVPVVLLDARPRREPVGSRSICQQRDVLDIWDSVGVGRRIAAEGVTWHRARTFHRDRELFCHTFADPGRSAFPPFVNLSQSRTEQLLDERISAEPRIDVRWGHRVVALDQVTAGVTVGCATPAGEAALRVDYAVACTGGRCDELRRLLGVSFAGHSFADRFLICDIRADLPGWADERRFYFDPAWNPGRQVLIHPCPGSTFRIDWQVPDDFDLAAEEAGGALDRRIRAIVGDRPYEVVWRSVYRFSARLVDRMRVGRVLLAGDCAHLMAPFGARGLNSGVADVENAAWKLAFALRGWAGPELLESYHHERHAAAVENLAVVGATMDFLVPHTEAQRRHRGAVLAAAVTDPAARVAVDSGRLAEPFWYVDSPLTTPDPTRPFGGRPAKGGVPPAAPGVLLPDVPVSLPGSPHGRLRELARDGLLLLAGPRADAGAALRAAAAATAAPVRLLALPEVDRVGVLTRALAARPGEVWLVRPDAHVAAVLDDPDTARVAAAVHRALGRPTPDER
ncbi:pentachlorophenol monooxygenase/3-(3-hydroxy-phenyl)propionate hydroxylase [Amycolatopsis arida]|uniref:Pentachlorophenol monooxygenase/3-(3-hydroxy-phenyl)propionate hydroxylase n=1 Tax=Amycolatopsis arida TaxID=587909 RepID=A0A1I5KPT7_9PSEU|nr:FAD-dependent monooxygenase [Amycolatopsis arida]TDX97149.1 pentachlorophenol monooxygenase/3-(3-hydroxy-phenyl)propionate hydroxylase [Amycolatopsis arida]SFO87120.1 pentachlorophenol monooxygenase/3-(3-hydroxy-phenyl)propionate hydroxylase [Amycolatopsis arida]